MAANVVTYMGMSRAQLGMVCELCVDKMQQIAYNESQDAVQLIDALLAELRVIESVLVMRGVLDG